MNAVVLYTRVMPYTVHCFSLLVQQLRVNIHLVHYPISSSAPYELKGMGGMKYYGEENLSYEALCQMIIDLNPKFLFVSGWSNKKYLRVASFAKEQGVPVIGGCDTPWRNDFRQIIAVLFSKFLIRRYFNYLMVAGTYQYEYGRLLGFKRENILKPLYLANTTLFAEKFHQFYDEKQRCYPKNILFVGRFEKVKGVSLLLEAFTSISDKNGWKLTLIGNGTLKDDLTLRYNDNSDIVFKDFLQPPELINEIRTAGAFCLPSVYEPWGVVVQEFTAAGLPLITSDVCGASDVFVKNNYNGFLHKAGDTNDLSRQLECLMHKPSEELLAFSQRSNAIAKALSAEMFVANFGQFLDGANDKIVA